MKSQYINGSVIKQVKEMKVLGIIVDEKLIFKLSTEHICTKARESNGCLKAELGILPIDIRLQELNRMECLKLLRKNDNALKDKLIISCRNPKYYPSLF